MPIQFLCIKSSLVQICPSNLTKSLFSCIISSTYMPEAMPNIAPNPEPKKILPPRPRTKAEKLARMLKQAEELPDEDVELLEDDVEEIPDTDVELLDADEDGPVPSGIHSIPPPPRMRKAETGIESIDTAKLQLERTVEARTTRLVDGISATFTMEKPEKRADAERGEDAVFIYEDPEIGPMAGVADGLGENNSGNGKFASEKIVAILPEQLTRAYNELRDAPAEELREATGMLSIVRRNVESGTLELAETPEQKRSEIFFNLYPEIARKALAISNALKAANEDVRASGGKTTFSFSVIHMEEDGGKFAITANIGDSGTLLQRADGSVELVTVEDSALNQLIEMGAIDAELLAQMRAEPAKKFPVPKYGPLSYEYLKRANTQALGGKGGVEPTITVTELEPGDRLIALTDGYLDFLEHEGELDLNAVKGALKEKDPVARMNRLREITGVLSRLQKQEGEALKEPDDMAAVELSV